MHFVLFVPGEHGFDANALLASLGLSALIDPIIGASVCGTEYEVGGETGKMIRWDDPMRTDRNATAGVEDKTWWWDYQRRFAIGWLADAPPTPEDLQRMQHTNDCPMLTSYPCRLADGRVWLVPIARHLPRQWAQCRETGRPILEATPQFAWYWEEITDAFGRIESQEITLDNQPPELFGLAVRALALNYRLCPEVCYATGLLAQESAAAIIGAACEFSFEFDAQLTWNVRATNSILDQKKTDARSLASVT